MAKKIVFPRHLYKKGGEIEWNYGLTYSRIYVKNREEYDKALRAGWIDDFDEALYGEEPEDIVDGTSEEIVTEPEEETVVTKEPEPKKGFFTKKPTAPDDDDF